MSCSPENTARSAGAILDRIKQALGLESDGDISRTLNIGRSTVGGWRAQDRRPYELCVDLHDRQGVSLDWLLTGQGEIFRSAPGAQSQSQSQSPVVADQDPPLDPRLAGILAWWRQWWTQASEAERTWALVQLARAFPEYAEAAADPANCAPARVLPISD